MALASPRPEALQQLLPLLRDHGFTGELNGLDLLSPEGVIPWGGLFLPDPSIGRWALWRQPVGASMFSLIGQIHTLSTPAALAHLQDLVSEPVQPWDALICSSTAGRSVVEAVLDSREEALGKVGRRMRRGSEHHGRSFLLFHCLCLIVRWPCRQSQRARRGLLWAFQIQPQSCFGLVDFGLYQARSMADLHQS